MRPIPIAVTKEYIHPDVRGKIDIRPGDHYHRRRLMDDPMQQRHTDADVYVYFR